MQATLAEARAFWASNDRDAKAIKKADGDYAEGFDPSRKVHMHTVFTLNPKDAGAGSGGSGSAKVFWTPYSAPDRKQRLTTENGYDGYATSLGVDPMFVLAHELHHAYGSDSEFDKGSEVVGVAAHLRTGLQHNIAPPQHWLYSEIATLMCGTSKARRDMAGRTIRYLQNRYPQQLRQLATSAAMYSAEEWDNHILPRVLDAGKRKPKAKAVDATPPASAAPVAPTT